jgi:murein DD-endopeptidase MepM/ murein hydrolase activator NlpD
MPRFLARSPSNEIRLHLVALLLTLLLGVGAAPAQACSTGKGHFARPTDGRISRGFGLTLNPLTGTRVFHSGMDFDAPVGQPVRAAEAGTVSSISDSTEFGKVVRLDNGDGFETVYAHLSRIEVSQGDCLAFGSRLGAVGDSGASTHPHLHFELIEHGRAVDPLRFLQSKN